jgi:VCBS repeat-containing protein
MTNDNMVNSSLDFVSADVNEVLQEARRQKLTNLEQQNDGQHPNELDKSTTVQVTKQSGDEDPMEVMVLHSEDGVQLKVEVTEQGRQQEQKCKGTHFVEQVLHIFVNHNKTKLCENIGSKN